MPAITVYPSNAEVPPHIECQIRSFIRITWFDGYQFNLDEPLMPEDWHPVHVVLAEKHVVFSYAAAVWRTIHHAGQSWKMYGLSSVFTYPAFRGKGYSGQVVKIATEHIQKQADADLAILFTDPNLKDFYAQTGWQPIPGTPILTGSPESPEIYNAFTMMLFLSDRAKQARPAFESGRIYFGEYGW